MIVDRESRISFGIEWHDDEAEADAREHTGERNGGFFHGMVLGRDPIFDREVEGRKQYAVTVP